MSDEIYLCIFVREFPAQARLRMREDLRSMPVAILDGEAPFQQVCSLNRQAGQLGVAAGMSRAEMDCFPFVTLLPRSAAEEQSTRTALLECAGNYSPRIEEIVGEDAFCCVLDISGTEKLFGNPESLAIRLRHTLEAIGMRAYYAVSANFHTAVFLARGASRDKVLVVVPDGGERQALASLPLSVLDISQDYAETFADWGITTLGTLAILPERDTISRLGQEGKRLRSLARGEAAHLFQPIDPVCEIQEQVELDSPVELLDSLLFVVGTILEQLLARARERILSLAVVIAELGLEGGEVHIRVVRPALPTNDKYVWLKLLHLDLIAHPPPVPVLSVKLKVESGAVGKVQLGLFSPQLPEPGRLDITLARIKAIVGEERLGTIELKDTHEPDAFRLKEFSVIKAGTAEWSGPQLPAAAMRRLRPPETIAVTLRNKCPHIFYFRGVGYRAERSYGPWRASGGWWSDGRWSLEVWDVVARMRDTGPVGITTPEFRGEVLLCCCITQDVLRDHWQIEALFD
jgi:protein ImuB